MKQITLYTRNLLKNQLISSSLIMVLGSNVFNFGQFIYHFLMGRFLGKVYYGDLAAIISILGIVTIVQMAFNLTVVRFIAANKNEATISNFIKWVYKWSITGAAMAAVLVFVFASHLASFLNLSSSISAYLLSPILFFFVIIVNGRSILQGLLKFNSYVVSLMAEGIIKISVALILVSLGYALFGALIALLLGGIVSFLVVRFAISKYLKGPLDKRPQILPLLKYSFFVFLQGLALTSMYSVDLLLVKHFFSASEAGVYASLAVLGRIVFFGISPIIHVMFPLVVKRYQSGENYYKIFYLSLMMAISLSLVVIIIFWFFPELAIVILFGPQFLEGASILWWFGLFMMLLAFAMLVTQFYLSIGKTKIVYLFVLAALLQIILIWFIHPTLLSVIQLSIFAAALLNLLLFVYFFYLKFNYEKKTISYSSRLQTK